jgi:hypothetical protein
MKHIFILYLYRITIVIFFFGKHDQTLHHLSSEIIYTYALLCKAEVVVLQVLKKVLDCSVEV